MASAGLRVAALLTADRGYRRVDFTLGSGPRCLASSPSCSAYWRSRRFEPPMALRAWRWAHPAPPSCAAIPSPLRRPIGPDWRPGLALLKRAPHPHSAELSITHLSPRTNG